MSASTFPLSYYLGLTSSQYRISRNFQAWLAVNLQLCQDIVNCAADFDANLDLGEAIGTQLDALGLIIGASRVVGFQPSDGVSPVLDDATYRLLLQATVYKNHWNGLLSSLRTIWNALFPGGILLFTDNQNMSVNFYVAAPLTSILQDLISNDLMLPRPQGVQYIFSFAGLPLFGFDQSTPWVAGPDVGHFA